VDKLLAGVMMGSKSDEKGDSGRAEGGRGVVYL